MITVHHLNNSRSQRVLWLLEELGLPYEIKRYERHPKTFLAPLELRKIHPLGKSPVLTDNDVTVAESGAITEYLINRYGQGKLRPAAGTAEELKYQYWLHYAEGSAMPAFILGLIFSMIEKQPVPFFIKPIIRKICQQINKQVVFPQINLHTSFMESELSKTPWFAGHEFTAADILMSFPVQAASTQADFISSKPKMNAFLSKIQSRPAYVRALQKGGPFEILK